MRLFDSHCHIDFPQFDEDRAAMIGRMQETGLVGCVAVSVELEALPRLFRLAESEVNVWASVGIHPNHETRQEPTVDQLCELAQHSRCVAIGETGMDFFRHHVSPEVQEARFRTHIRAARELAKPVIVHMREADADTLRVLEEEGIAYVVAVACDTMVPAGAGRTIRADRLAAKVPGRGWQRMSCGPG